MRHLLLSLTSSTDMLCSVLSLARQRLREEHAMRLAAGMRPLLLSAAFGTLVCHSPAFAQSEDTATGPKPVQPQATQLLSPSAVPPLVENAPPAQAQGAKRPPAITSSIFAPIPGGDPGPPCKPLAVHWSENWSCLADPKRKRLPLEALRYFPLGGSGSYLSIGGELREDYFGTTHSSMGARVDDRLEGLRQRVRLFADLHLSDNLRAFVELGANHEFGVQSKSPVNSTGVDIQQAFVDITVPLASNVAVTFRPGRFEMPLGNAKLIGIREGTNERYLYQGLRTTLVARGVVTVDTFITDPVAARPGDFDEGPNKGTHFRGAYISSAPSLLIPNTSIDVYAYKSIRPTARLGDGSGRDARTSIGIRFAGKKGPWDFDAEGTYQTGHIGTQDIRAWATLLEAGYTLKDAPLKPRFAVNANAFSGDHKPGDGKVATFVPAFPKYPMLNEASWMGFSNLVDVHPSVRLHPTPKLALIVGPDFYWRQSSKDSVYAATTAAPVITPVGSQRFFATTYDFQVDWAVTRNLTLHAYYTRLEASRSFKAGGGQDTDYWRLNATFRF